METDTSEAVWAEHPSSLLSLCTMMGHVLDIFADFNAQRRKFWLSNYSQLPESHSQVSHLVAAMKGPDVPLAEKRPEKKEGHW